MFDLAAHYQDIIPLFAVAIFAEMGYSAYRQMRLYSAGETWMNVQMALSFFGLDLVFKVVWFMVLGWCYAHRLVEPIDNPWLYWPVAIVFQDFCYFIHHYLDHHVRVMWAVHVTHHSSEEFNITTGFRSPVLQPLFRYVFYVPMAFLGFGAFDILVCYALTQHWGTLAHTQTVGKLHPWFEFVFVTPSHHRVHHGSNPRYLDRNMGMFLIIWDRIFGTFTEGHDDDPVRYGLTKPLTKPRNLLHVIGHEWADIWHDLRRAPTWRDRWQYVFGPPGWSHDGSRQTSAELRQRLGLEQKTEQKPESCKHFCERLA